MNTKILETAFSVSGDEDFTEPFLKALENVGLIIEQPDPIDKRFLRYVCADSGVKIASDFTEQTELPPVDSHIVLEILGRVLNELSSMWF